MTEKEWLRGRKRPDTMLAHVASQTTQRKLRLYACGCVRVAYPHLLSAQNARELLALVELCADDVNGRNEMQSSARSAWEAVGGGLDSSVARRGRGGTPEENAAVIAALAGFRARYAATYFTEKVWQRQNPSERVALCDLAREVFGNPFRPVAVEPSWLTSTVLALARGIYEEKAFDRMPILADALQDAGCDNEDVFDHCRDAGAAHVRGCWVIDVLLGKA